MIDTSIVLNNRVLICVMFFLPTNELSQETNFITDKNYRESKKHVCTSEGDFAEENFIVNDHCRHVSVKFSVNAKDRQHKFPTIYMLPNLLKNI